MVLRCIAMAIVTAGSSCMAQVAGPSSAKPVTPIMDKAPEDGHLAVPLWSGAAPGALGTEAADVPTITAYLPANNPTHTAIVVAPGGGYSHLALDHEGAQVAQWLNAHGVAAFVLKYRIGPKYHHPVELEDVQRAIRTVRAQASEHGYLPDHVGVMGFSAGGHLASSAGTHFDAGNSTAADPIDRVSSRPDFMILGYPVIFMGPPGNHAGSAKNLLGANPDLALVELMSSQKQVTSNTPPTFIWSTTDDKTVPIMNSVAFYEALVKNGVPAELHIFRSGKHGLGLAQKDKDVGQWPSLLLHWLAANGWATLD